MSNAEKMVKFLNGCHSVFHAVALMEKQLQEEGFTELFENEDDRLKALYDFSEIYDLWYGEVK